MKFGITRGIVVKAQKVVIYGPEGIGKTSFAADFPGALFIDTEGSTNMYDVSRLPAPSSWSMLLEEITEVMKTPGVCKTLVIDTVDWAEQLCVAHICAKHNKKGIEDFGYGNGYVYVKEEFGRMLNLLSEVISKGIHVVLTAHSHIKKFEQPNESGSYDRYELKLGKKTSSQTAPLLKEWSDMILFANYKVITYNQNKEGKGKAAGGERVMYTTHHPNWDAKNRHDLAEELPFSYKSIEACITSIVAALPQQAATSVPQAGPVATAASRAMSNLTAAPETPPPATTQNAPPKPPEDKSSPANWPEPEFIDDTSLEPAAPKGIPKELADLMAANNVRLDEIQEVVARKGYYPPGTPFENYESDFVHGCLVGAWEQVYALIQAGRSRPAA